ncbi:hypothetical protein D4R52_02065 [bacterium]|nr:MAG: hypothetical protein D4R52_02065 [bacterium]
MVFPESIYLRGRIINDMRLAMRKRESKEKPCHGDGRRGKGVKSKKGEKGGKGKKGNSGQNGQCRPNRSIGS